MSECLGSASAPLATEPSVLNERPSDGRACRDDASRRMVSPPSFPGSYRAHETTKAASGVPGGLCERFAKLARTLGKIHLEWLFKKRQLGLDGITLEIRAPKRKTRGHDKLGELG